MKPSTLLTDDGAVSEVIGVILMVAVTVILAAVVGTFVLGLADSFTETAPSASYDWEEGDGVVTLTHVGGQGIDAPRVSGTINGTAVEGSGDEQLGTVWAGNDRITSGDDVTWVSGEAESSGEVGASGEAIAADASLRVIWTAADGGSSSTLTTFTVRG